MKGFGHIHKFEKDTSPTDDIYLQVGPNIMIDFFPSILVLVRYIVIDHNTKQIIHRWYGCVIAES